MGKFADLSRRLRERAGQYDEEGWHNEIENEAADAIDLMVLMLGGEEEKDTLASRISKYKKAGDG